jgi:hypothetical protein
VSGDYRDWFASEECKEFVRSNIRKSGIPLELRAKKILKGKDFSVASGRYLEPDGIEGMSSESESGIWRELDIYATRYEKPSFMVGGCEVKFMTSILGECKYSSDKDLFVFE